MDRLEGCENVDHVIGMRFDMHQSLDNVFGGLENRATANHKTLALGYRAGYHAKQSDTLAAAAPVLLGQCFQIPFLRGACRFHRIAAVEVCIRPSARRMSWTKSTRFRITCAVRESTKFDLVQPRQVSGMQT
jgi:hypothetical protein